MLLVPSSKHATSYATTKIKILYSLQLPPPTPYNLLIWQWQLVDEKLKHSSDTSVAIFRWTIVHVFDY